MFDVHLFSRSMFISSLNDYFCFFSAVLILVWLPVLVFGSCSTIFMIRTEYSSSLSSKSYVCFFIFSHSTTPRRGSMLNVHKLIRSHAGALERGIPRMVINYLNSLFNVGRSMFDVRRSSFYMFDVHLFFSLLPCFLH